MKMGMTKIKERLSYGVGAFGKDLCYALVSTYLMVYLTDVAMLDAAFVGMLFCFARIFDAFNDPFMGVLVDNTKSKWGRFRPWIAVGTAVNAIVLILLFTKPNFSAKGLTIYYSVMYVLWGVTYTLMDVPFWSMIPALAADRRERNVLSVIPRIFAGAGNVTVGALTLLFVNNVIGDETKGFFYFALIVAAVFMLTSFITVKNVHERYSYGRADKIGLRDSLRALFRNDQLLICVSSVMLINIGLNLTASFGVYYFKYDLNQENLFSIFYALGGAAQAVAMIAFPFLAYRLSRRCIFICGCILPIIGNIILFLAGILMRGNIAVIATGGAIAFIGYAFITVLSTVMLADSVDYGEFKLGIRADSVVFSMQTFMVKLSSAVASLCAGFGLSFSGFIANGIQNESTLLVMRLIMFAAPSVLAAFALLIYVRRYKLNGEFYEDMMGALEERRRGE